MRIASWPLTWYWKCGASQLWVSAIGLTSLDQRQPGSKTNLTDLAVADVEDLGATVGELARLVGVPECPVLGGLARACGCHLVSFLTAGRSAHLSRRSSVASVEGSSSLPSIRRRTASRWREPG
jgi:hypothetical protein